MVDTLGPSAGRGAGEGMAVSTATHQLEEQQRLFEERSRKALRILKAKDGEIELLQKQLATCNRWVPGPPVVTRLNAP